LFMAHYIIASNIKEMHFHMYIKNFFPGIFIVLLFSIMFYIMKDLLIIRWILGILLGIFAIVKIIKRKSIF